MRYVLGFMFSKDGNELLLIEKSKPASIAGHWNGLGGKVDRGELFEAAMAREFEEECGIHVDVTDWEHCLFFTGEERTGEPWTIRVYRTFGNVWEFQKLESERPAVFRVDDLENVKIVPNLRWMIPLLRDQNVVFPIAIHQS